MWPDRVSNLGPLALESDALPTELCRLIRVYIAYSFIKDYMYNELSKYDGKPRTEISEVFMAKIGTVIFTGK